MIPNITRGTRIGGLMGYLAGKGRHNEHEEQHLVAGDSAIMAMHGYDVLDASTAQAIARSLDMPRQAFGVDVTRMARAIDPETGEVVTSRVAADVWHCSLSLRSEEGQLSDEKWGEIAQQFVDRMGFTEASGKAACRWVAVRHGLSTNGNDHIHIAVSLVREDGTKASTHNDFKRAQDLCRELEKEHGLEPLESRELGRGERGIKPAERERPTRLLAEQLKKEGITGDELKARLGAVTIDAHKLERTVRAAAAASLDEGEFVRRCRQAGVLIRPRFAAGRDDVVAGYSVALRPPSGAQPIWYGGGRLARDLTLPRMREGWPDTPLSAQAGVDEWRATSRNPWQYRPVAPGREMADPSPEMWGQYAAEMGALRDQMRAVPIGDRAAWAHFARETSGVFAAWSQRVETEPGDLAKASRMLARSAHLRAHQSRPRSTRLTSGTNTAMLMLQAANSSSSVAAEVVVLRQLGRMAVAILDAHAALGEARRAEQLTAMMRDQVAAVTARVAPLEQSAATTSSEAVRLATEGLAAPGSGSPLPRPLQPEPRKTPVTPRERDGLGRE